MKKFNAFISDMLKSEGHYSINKFLGLIASIVLLFLCCYAILSKHDYSETVLISVFSTLCFFVFTMFGLRTVNRWNFLKYGSKKEGENNNG